MNASAPLPSPPPTRHAPIALWRVAEAFMHTLYALFGAPEDVAAEHTLTGAAHKLMASWIHCAEPFARRLARALHALPHRVRELFRTPEEAQHRIEDWDVFDAGAQRAWPVADTS